MGKTNLVRRISSLVIILSLIFQQTGFAQMAAQMDLSGYLGGLKNSSVKDIYRPAHLRYFSYDNLTDNFKLLVEKGDSLKSVGTGRDLSVINAGGQDNKIKQEARELLKYFLTGVSLQDDIFWVNLRPDSQDQIIDNWLEKTDVGRIMLEADLQLKKDTALWTSPETTLGRKYWDKLYKKAAELYGYDNITIPTLTRPWIVPGEIIVRETRDEGRGTTPSAYIYKAVLKVMLEQDYLKGSNAYDFKDERAKILNKYSSQLIRELIIPKLTKEVNSSKRYAALRQVYYSLILSRWFKMRFSGKQGAYSSLINSSNLNNLTSQEPWSKAEYFKQYQKSFTEGEYNIKELVSTPTGQVIRSYFSGGLSLGPKDMVISGFGFNGGAKSSAILLGPQQGKMLFMGKVSNSEFPDLRLVKDIETTAPRAEKRASSAISFERAKDEIFDQEIAKMEQKLVNDQFEQMINGSFGKKKDEVNSKIAQIGFDGKANRLGWTTAGFDWIFSHSETVEQVLTDAQNIRDNYDNVVFCGMGGSGLSVEAVKTTYGDKKIHIYSLRTTDPATIAHILEDEIGGRYIYQGKKDLKKAMSKTLFVVISKSWKTPETLKHFEYLNQLYSQLELNFNNNVWAVTDKSSPGDTGKYTQRDIQLNGEGDIGGRFTAPTTNVFLLPLALVANEKVWRILERARDMHKAGDMTGGQFVKLAAFLCYNAEKLGRNKLTFIVPEEFRAIPFWSEQLFEESLGKDGKGVTMFYGETLSPKMLKPVENEDRVFVRIDLKGKNTQGEFWKYLQDKGYAAFDIAVEDKDDIGGVMLGLQRTVAGIAYLWDINFVNQPAVEDYKIATNEILGKLKPGEKVTVPADWTNSVSYKDLTFYIDTLYQAKVITSNELQAELQILNAQQTDAAAVFAAIMRVLLSKHANFETMLLAPYGMTTTALRKSLEEIRGKIFTNKLKLPTKIAEGPDYNHSFQQNVAAGTDIFFSLLGMVNNPRQPQVLAFGDNLIKAQVLGTVESITAAGRKAMLWTTGATMDETAVQLGEFFNEVGNYLDVGTTSATASSSIEAKFEQKFSERLKQGDKAVVKEIKQYYSGLGVDDQQIAYEYLQAHESALAADALSAVGLPWNGVVKALVAKIKGEKEGNHRASARQLKELATKETCAGLTPPTQEIVSEAQRVWSENPQFNRLTGRVIFPEFPVLQVDKPGKLVLIRHGETDWSEAVLNKWAGWYDAHVTQNGLKGAFNAGLSLKDIKFDKAYTSDLSRAKDTLLQILFATAQTDVEQIVSAELRERDYGTGGMIGWRRSEVEEVFGKDILKNWRRGYDTDEARPFGGENLLDVQERSVPYFIENIMVDIARGKTVIISAHGNSLRAILIELRRYTNNAQVPEAEIIKLEVPLSEPIVVGFDKELRVNNAQGPKLIIQFLGSSTPQNQTGSVSSSLQAMPENAGAIDFRGKAMNINYQAMGSFKGLDLKLPQLSKSELDKINIDSEIQQIKKMVSSGISPSGTHIMEIVAACEQKGRMSAYSRDLLLCVVNACELAEVNADDNSPDFNKALMFIDSRS